MKKALFIAPTFFGYYQGIIVELEKRGFSVVHFDDRPSNSFFSKTMIRLNKGLMKRSIDKYFSKILETIRGEKIDLVFFLLAQSFSAKHVAELKKEHPEADYVFYAWDAVSNFPNIAENAPLFNRVYTFDDKDAAKYGYTLLPLYYSNPVEEKEADFDFSAVLTIKKGKYARYKSIVKQIPDSVKPKGYEFLFIQSKLVYLYYKLRYKEFKGARKSEFSFKKMPVPEFYDILNRSKVVIDCQMAGQTGLTMRTFEALHAGKKVITTNANVKNYPFYCPENIFVIEEGGSPIPESFFSTPFDQTHALTEEYSLSHFVDTILGSGKAQ